MPTLSKTSVDRLLTCDPRLQLVLNGAIKIVDFTVMEGHRGEAAQNDAFKRGASKLRWPDGKHNMLPSRAVDIAPVHYVSGKLKIDWNDLVAFGRLMGVVQAVAHRHGIRLRFGLDWDGDFLSVNRDTDESFMDAPHVELID
jgi:peptidoglycan L-alanyl-D-glutamate endopeptidase CwlK